MGNGSSLSCGCLCDVFQAITTVANPNGGIAFHINTDSTRKFFLCVVNSFTWITILRQG
jgi:hypothetical protein